MARGNLLEGNLYRTILRLSLPIMVNNFIQTLYNLVDSLWLGRVGSDELAAVSFVWPINSLFIAMGMGLSIAGISLMSQHLGADEREEANRYATQLTAVAVLSGVVFGLIGSAERTLCPPDGRAGRYDEIQRRLSAYPVSGHPVHVLLLHF